MYHGMCVQALNRDIKRIERERVCKRQAKFNANAFTCVRVCLLVIRILDDIFINEPVQMNTQMLRLSNGTFLAFLFPSVARCECLFVYISFAMLIFFPLV